MVEDLFKVSGKPRQQTGGIGGKGFETVCKLDARGSRPNSVWEYPYPLPIFSPLDEPERCLDDTGVWVRAPRELDYFWIAASDLGLDLDDPDDADDPDAQQLSVCNQIKTRAIPAALNPKT